MSRGSKLFLRKIYTEWYETIIKEASLLNEGKLLEIGSGDGFLKEIHSEFITSDIRHLPHLDMIIDAEKIPFDDEELSCIGMTNVFHHIPRPYLFLREAERTLKPGGKVIMVEPTNTLFSRFVYKNFHFEPFDEKGGREIREGAIANQALPYIYFERDRHWFETTFTQLKIEKIEYHTAFRYIISGGMSMRQLLPSFSYPVIHGLELMLHPLRNQIAMFSTIILKKLMD